MGVSHSLLTHEKPNPWQAELTGTKACGDRAPTAGIITLYHSVEKKYHPTPSKLLLKLIPHKNSKKGFLYYTLHTAPSKSIGVARPIVLYFLL